MRDTRQPWFKMKKYGYGWGLPATWQGWIVFLSYLLFMIGDFFRIDRASHSASDTLRPFIVQVIIASLVLSGIIYLTGERPHKH